MCDVTDRPQCKKSEKVLKELENIDDEADQKGIGFVKINDDDLAEEYSLWSLPTLVYYRNGIPIIYEGTLFKYIKTFFNETPTQKKNYFVFLSGDLLREEDVLEWLVQNKNTASEEEDMIEDVTAKTLEAMTNTVAHLAVLFCKSN